MTCIRDLYPYDETPACSKLSDAATRRVGLLKTKTLKPRVLIAVCAASFLLQAQAPPPADSVTFQSKVNLVPVPVVVRDKTSHTVGNLTQDDFELFDNGKRQAISRFSIEKSGVENAPEPLSRAPHAGVPAASAPATNAPAIPDRFVAYVFDDLHFRVSDLMQSKLAALKHFDAQIGAATRAAVFTTSGIKPEDFTSDREKLKAALNRLMPRSSAQTPQTQCPYISYYAADLILNKDDSEATQDAMKAAMYCPVPPPSKQSALSLVRSLAFQTASVGETETRITLSALRSLIKRMAALPGQRTLVLVSPGFIFPGHEQEISELIDQAVRMRVVVNSIDARGLYVDARYDASRSSVNTSLPELERAEAADAGDTLALVAEGTGGAAFANSNDLLEGFRRAASPPEFTYVLGFSPENLKNDGKFHSLKVKLKKSSGFTVQARRGYFAPKHAMEPADQAKQDIDDALFSRQEINDFPLAISTQLSKGANNVSGVTVIAHVGLKAFHFRKAGGLNLNHLTLVAALFDQNGNYVTAIESNVDLRYKEETLEARLNAGLAVKTSFETVKPGSYLVRLVAHDSEGQMMSTANGSVEVP